MRTPAKTIVIIIVAVFLIAAFIYLLPLLKPDIVPGNWKSYENSRYGFSIKYPNNWELGEKETGNAGREFFSPDREIQCYAYGFQNALVTEDGDPQTLEEFITWLKQGPEFEFISQNQTELGGIKAIELISQEGGNIKQAVYVLGKDTGRGLFCIFKDQQAKQNFQKEFKKIKQSFEINVSLDGEEVFVSGHEMCEALLNNSSIPLEDLQTFLDDTYNEVTTISREDWQRDRLPEQVLALEKQNYTCYPMPFEMEQGEVKNIQWSCELEYEEWEYISKDNPQRKIEMADQGYECEKRICFTNQSQQSFVWLCGR